MESKKPTKQQIENRIRRAIIHIDKTKDTKDVYFDDKGLRLVVNEDYAIVSTASHSHVFDRITSTGVSRPYIYVERFIEVVESHEKDVIVEDTTGNKRRSYAKFFEVLEKQEDKNEYNICWYIDKWFDILFAPLYAIGESEAQSFLLYEAWLHNIARNYIIFSEKKEDITKKQFVEQVTTKMNEFIVDMDDNVLFEKKTDEQVMQENIEALREHEFNESLVENS